MDDVIKVRVSAIDREAWERAALADARPLSDWIRARVEGLPTTAPSPDIATRRTPRRSRR